MCLQDPCAGVPPVPCGGPGRGGDGVGGLPPVRVVPATAEPRRAGPRSRPSSSLQPALLPWPLSRGRWLSIMISPILYNSKESKRYNLIPMVAGVSNVGRLRVGRVHLPCRHPPQPGLLLSPAGPAPDYHCHHRPALPQNTGTYNTTIKSSFCSYSPVT